MNWKKIFAVIRREYVERIRTKAFWIGTALIPVFFFLYIAIQVATSHRAGGERQIAVVDATGHLYEPLVEDLATREKAREKSVSVEFGGELLWFSLNAKGELWLNAKDAKASAEEGGDEKKSRRPRSRSKKSEDAVEEQPAE